MDPRIGWHQNELSSSAYSTWTNIWMVAQLNCTAAAAANSLNSANSSHSASAISVNQLDHNNHNQLDRNTSNSYSKFISMIEMSSQQQQHQHQYNTNNNTNSSNDYNNNNNSSNVNTSVTSQSILNGLKSRKFNKASTFGFNFPINQHILDDPMSTPWLMSHCSNSKNLLNSSLSLLFLSNSNSSSSHIRNKSFQPLTHSHLSDEQSSYSSYLLNKTRNRSVTGSTSSSTSTSLSISSASSTSSSASSPTNISLHHPNHHLNHNQNLMTSHDDDSSSLLSMANLSHLNSYEEDQLIQSTALINEINAPLINNNLTSNNVYSDGLMSLHKEILSFSEYIAPTLEELYMRNEIIWKITKIIKDELPSAEVDVFGSYKTGLFLPTSDIDMVVFGEFGKPNSLLLKVLRDALIKEKISNDENIRVLDKASVPIIKILETKTDIKVDISFNTLNGVKSAELIKKYLIEYPCLRPLVMVLKQFLIQRDFNEVWTGGIGSYSLILMTVSFLQLHPRIDARSCHANLGVLLIEFFELYGRCFNYMKTAIRILNGGCYLPKEEILKQFSTGYRSSVLCIEDPLNPANDIGKGSYGALKVKQAFEYAYFTLSHAVLPQNEFILKNNTQSIHQPQSILGRIIRITKEVRDYRSWVHEHFKDKVSIVYESNKQQQQQQTQQQQNELVILANGIDVDSEMKLVNEVKPVFSQPLPPQQQQPQPIVSLTLPPQITLTVQPLDIQTNTSSTSASITCSSSSSSSSNTSNSTSDDDQSNKENKIFDEIIFNHEKALGLNSINVLNNSNNHNHTNLNNSSSNLNILKDYQQNYHNSNNNNNNNNQLPPPPMQIHHQKSYEHSSKANNMNQTLTYLNQQYQQQQQHNNNVANNIKSNNRKKSNSSVRSFDSNESNNSNNSNNNNNNNNNNNCMNTNMNNNHYSVNNNSLQVIKAYNMNKKLKYTLDANTTSNGSNSNNNQKHSNQNQRFQTNKFNSNPNQMNNLNNNNKNNNKNNYGNSLNGGYHKQHNNNKYNYNNNNNNNNSSQQFFQQQQQQHIHHHHHHQHHSSQPIEQHKPVTFYLDEELQAMNNGRGAGGGGGGDEPELKRFINNLEANYLMQHSLLTPASAPISPCEFISKEDEPISRKKDPRNNSASLVDQIFHNRGQDILNQIFKESSSQSKINRQSNETELCANTTNNKASHHSYSNNKSSLSLSSSSSATTVMSGEFLTKNSTICNQCKLNECKCNYHNNNNNNNNNSNNNINNQNKNKDSSDSESKQLKHVNNNNNIDLKKILFEKIQNPSDLIQSTLLSAAHSSSSTLSTPSSSSSTQTLLNHNNNHSSGLLLSPHAHSLTATSLQTSSLSAISLVNT